MGGGVNIIGRSLQHGNPKFFHIIFLPILKFFFVLLEWLKFLKNPLEEDSPIAAPEIGHILSLYLPILKV